MLALKMMEAGGLSPLSSVTLSERIADRIVDAIAQGQIAAGQRLIETELAEALDVSRVPVREAMRIFSSQGIIVPAPKRGMQVAAFTDIWANQLRDVRIAIERQATPLAAHYLAEDPSLVRRIEDRIDALAQAEGDWLAVNKADIAFHTAVYDLAQSPLFWTLWGAISRHVLILFSIEVNRDPNFKAVLEEHRTYLKLMLAGDVPELDREIALHIEGPRKRKPIKTNATKEVSG